MFRVGQKVVCVDGNFIGRNNHCCIFPVNLPVEGNVYTIRNFMTARGKEFLRLVEITNELQPFKEDGGPFEAAFAVIRFRPVVSRPTSIAIFQRILAPSREKETAL